MKKGFAVILSVLMVLSAAGCNRNAVDTGVNMVSSEAQLSLSRTEIQSVYGVEAPESGEEVSLPQESSAESQPQQDTSSSQQADAQQTDTSASGQADVQQADTSPSQQADISSSQPADTQQQDAQQTDVAQENTSQPHTQVATAVAVPGEVRGVWMSYLTLEPMIKGQSQAGFTANLDAAFAQAAALGFNTVFVQVRPFADALYDSQYFPWSYLLSGREGGDPGYDPLAIMCELADANGLRIEAWLNPYRVRTPGSDKELSAQNQAKKWLAQGDDAVLEWNGGIYYNPGSQKARELIVNGVREIVRNYPVDGIHFDDYFYPTQDMDFDKQTYRASGSSLSQADWRRENVNILVRQVYAAVKEENPNCLFGISPQGNMKNNYDGQFIDCAKWVSSSGYVDYICPQIYFGFENESYPFAQTVEMWDELITNPAIKLYVGIAAYKLGAEDTWAGSGKYEWQDTDGILAQMVEVSRQAEHYGGVALYSYESLFGSNTAQVKSEREQLKAVFEE